MARILFSDAKDNRPLGARALDEMQDRLKPCPACNKQQGELLKREGARFPYYVHRECGWITEFVKLPEIAVKLWNEAKRTGT